MNIIRIVKNDLCVSCGACEVICPTGAIKLSYDDQKGYLLPILAGDKCDNCGLCLKVCPGEKEEYHKGYEEDKLFGHVDSIFEGWTNNTQKRLESASGGLLTSFVNYLFNKGEIDRIICAVPTYPPMFCTWGIFDNSEFDNLEKGSWYIPIPILQALKYIDDKLAYAIVATPCQIRGLKYLQDLTGIYKNIKFKISLLCGAQNTLKGVEYLCFLNQIDFYKLEKIAFRKKPWPGNLLLKTKNKSIIVPSYLYYDYGYKQLFSLNRCMFCTDFTGINADVIFGDAWLKEYSNETDGVSIVLSRNSGLTIKLLKLSADGTIILKTSSKSRLYQSQSVCFEKKRIHINKIVYSATSTGKSIPDFDYKLKKNLLLTNYNKIKNLYVRREMAKFKSNWLKLNKIYEKKLKHLNILEIPGYFLRKIRKWSIK